MFSISEIERAIAFWESKKRKLEESAQKDIVVFNMQDEIRSVLSGLANITAMSEVGNELVIGIIFDNDRYEIRCSTKDVTSDEHLPDEETFTVMQMRLLIIEQQKRWPYHDVSSEVKKIKCNLKDDDLRNAFMRLLDMK